MPDRRRPAAAGPNGEAQEVKAGEAPPGAARRLASAQNLWLATVRPDGRPHLVPVWFVWIDSRFFLCTSPGSVKARNMRRNAQVAVALEDGTKPLICMGSGSPVRRPWPEDVVEAFEHKYGWKIADDVEYSRLIRIVPERWLGW